MDEYLYVFDSFMVACKFVLDGYLDVVGVEFGMELDVCASWYHDVSCADHNPCARNHVLVAGPGWTIGSLLSNHMGKR
jgi:hypothetical protein